MTKLGALPYHNVLVFRFTFTIFPSLHPNFGVSWENTGLESPPPLIFKKTMTTDQQPIKTNIYFSHFSDNFFHIFLYPNPNFGVSWEEMGMNHRCFPFFTYLFSIFPTHISILRGSWEKMGLDPLISYTLFPSPNPNFDMIWEKMVLKPNRPNVHL